MNREAIDFLKAAREGLAMQTAAHRETWHLGEERGWDVDLDVGVLSLQFVDGTIAETEIQVIGTYNTEDGTFLWAWDHPSIPEPLAASSLLAKQWGAANGMQQFVERKILCSEDDAWGFAAVANRLAGTNGAYRGPAGSALVFMTFGDVRLQRDNAMSRSSANAQSGQGGDEATAAARTVKKRRPWWRFW